MFLWGQEVVLRVGEVFLVLILNPAAKAQVARIGTFSRACYGTKMPGNH